jgi:hypothetical protein
LAWPPKWSLAKWASSFCPLDKMSIGVLSHIFYECPTLSLLLVLSWSTK